MSETDLLLKKIQDSKGKQMTLDALIDLNKQKIPQTQNVNNNNQEHKNSKSISLLLTIIGKSSFYKLIKEFNQVFLFIAIFYCL